MTDTFYHIFECFFCSHFSFNIYLSLISTIHKLFFLILKINTSLLFKSAPYLLSDNISFTAVTCFMQENKQQQKKNTGEIGGCLHSGAWDLQSFLSSKCWLSKFGKSIKTN